MYDDSSDDPKQWSPEKMVRIRKVPLTHAFLHDHLMPMLKNLRDAIADCQNAIGTKSEPSVVDRISALEDAIKRHGSEGEQ